MHLIFHSRRRPGRAGFTLVELMMAITILTLMSAALCTFSNHAMQMWARGESGNQHRMRARAALEFLGRELRQALLPKDPADTSTLQFVINPETVTCRNRDSIFWQAPDARDAGRSNLAEVGYFVRWTPRNEATLCRFHVAPGDPNYLVYTPPFPSRWISDHLLDAVAPADQSRAYQGLFLENVPGLWTTAFDAAGKAFPEGYDSRKQSNKLPAYIEVSLVLLDNQGATRLRDRPDLVAAIRELYPDTADPNRFLASEVLDPIRQHLRVTTFSVSLNNGR